MYVHIFVWICLYMYACACVDFHLFFTYVNPQQHIRNIDRGVYLVVQYHPGQPYIKGTSKKLSPIFYSSDRMSMMSSRPPVL